MQDQGLGGGEVIKGVFCVDEQESGFCVYFEKGGGIEVKRKLGVR